MTLQIEELTTEREGAYEEMLCRRADSLLYSSLKYRDFLAEQVGGERRYLIARLGNRVVGTLPMFLYRHIRLGNVLNSLPLFGSNGGVVTDGGISDQSEVKRSLLGALSEFASSHEVILATIITSPFDEDVALYERTLPTGFRDFRIGQVCSLPTPDSDVESRLLSVVHPSRRRNIAKARRTGINVSDSDDESLLRFLATTHRSNMESMDGRSKDWNFFRSLAQNFEYGADYRVYCATLGGKPIAALLLLYYNRTVEYFVPATLHDFRTYQPGSLLILEAMKEASRAGYRYWNFGGTHSDQRGVYDFKRRWGAADMPYHYMVSCFGDVSHLLAMDPAEISSEFPHYYVIPFSARGA